MMDNVDTHNLLVSKENIQPLRHGRDTSKLCAALQAETDSELQQILEKQRNEFEIRLRSHNSDDPLSDWCDYVHWIEQSFPKQPREGKLNVVLRKCLNKYKDTEKYKNDVRFVKLCIKYGEIEDNTVEFLSQIHRHGIGITCAELYIAWAEKYAMNNCFKKANIIYEKGIENRAEPLALLKEAHQNFHAFLVRRMLNVQEEFKPTFSEPAVQNFRQPYNVLRPVPAGQTEVISNIRVGPHVKGSPGKLKMGATQERKPKANTCIKIFEDIENEHAAIEPAAKLEKIPNKKKSSKENTVKPGPWTEKQNKKVPFNIEFSNNPFQVHRDEEEYVESNRVQNVPSSVLKSHKKKDYEEDTLANIPLFYPESEDKTKIAMYCKDQVYAGGLEFQFEELRAIEYNKKRLDRNTKNSKHDITEESNLGTSKQIGVDENVITPASKASSPLDSNKNITNEVIKPESNILKSKEDSDSGRIEKNTTKRKTIISKSKAVDQIGDNKCLTEEIVSTPDYSMNQTIHTKEALSEMQQLWFSKPASPLLQDNVLNKQAGKSILKPAKPCFNLYIDESCLDNFKNVEVPEGPLDLTLKSSSPPEILLPTRGNADINTEQVLDFMSPSQVEPRQKDDGLGRRITQFGDENKENHIPSDYSGEFGKSTRKVTGILTPAENVPVAPLSDGEDDEAYEEEDDLIYNGAAQCNTTGITENLTKAFQFPKNESTPNPRKSCQFKQNVNRSLFDFEDTENKNDAYEKVIYEEPVKVEEKQKGTSNIVSSARSPSNKVENHVKNLSVIVETSREYKSSSSGSSGVSTLQSRSFKNYPITPLDVKGYTCSTVASACGFNKTKKLSLTGYEASTESTQTGLKSGLTASGKLGFTKGLCDLNDYSSESFSSKAKEVEPVRDLIKAGITSGNNEENISPHDIDPFSDSVIDELLKLARFPSAKYANSFIDIEASLTSPKVGSCITLGYYKYDVKKILGEGSYARVYELTNKTTGNRIIGKIQKPPCRWEFYIIKELHLRINDKVKAESFMKVESAYFFQNSSVLLTIPVEFGNLLDTINALKQNQQLCQLTAVYFTVDILRILDILHSCKIIHADIKPDNFLIKNRDGKPRLQLIDFGRSIDMTLFPEGTTFNKVITTDGFTTTEMRTGKPWTYQVDLYGAANCSHCLLYGDYMTVTQKNGLWNITKLIPRYWAREEWKNYFTTLLNIESCNDIPKISSLIDPFEAMLTDNKELDLIVHRLNNLLMSR